MVTNIRWFGKDANDDEQLVMVNLRDIFDYTRLIEPPAGFSLLRTLMKDFNKIYQDEAPQPEQNNQKIILASTASNSTKETPELMLKTRLKCKYNNMCFYCGRNKNSGGLQCDHVVPVMSMLISLVPNNKIIYNFQLVHSTCNQLASNMSIQDLWHTIGDPSYFIGPNNAEYAMFPDGSRTVFSPVQIMQNKEYCRGYLATLLGHLEIASSDVQRHRITLVDNRIKDLKEYLDSSVFVLEHPEDDLDAAASLVKMTTHFDEKYHFESRGQSPDRNIGINNTRKKRKRL